MKASWMFTLAVTLWIAILCIPLVNMWRGHATRWPDYVFPLSILLLLYTVSTNPPRRRIVTVQRASVALAISGALMLASSIVTRR